MTNEENSYYRGSILARLGHVRLLLKLYDDKKHLKQEVCQVEGTLKDSLDSPNPAPES